jgi:Plant protein of unknown function
VLQILRKKLEELRMEYPHGGSEEPYATILKVPDWIKKYKKELYEPRMVSIGPYHLGNRHLQFMENEKLYSLRYLLELNPSAEIEVCVKEMRRLESAARYCYSNDIDLDSGEFVMMLLLDGCFILEFFMKAANGDLNARWDTNVILSDLYLLENQVPFFVIHKLYHIFCGCPVANCSYEVTCPLLKLILELPDPFNYDHRLLLSCPTIGNRIHHLCDLFYRAKLPNRYHSIGKPDLARGTSFFNGLGDEIHTGANIWTIMMPSATGLQKSGVKFKRKADAQHLFDVCFHNGILEMPFFKLSVATKIMLVNMIAFEESKLISLEKRISTSYVALLDVLINTEKDVSVLEQSGVFKNMLENDYEAAKFFNELGAAVQLNRDNHYYFDLLMDLKRFTNSTWNKYRARLFQDFSTNPWTFISVVTGAIALILTFIQTYYSAKP